MRKELIRSSVILLLCLLTIGVSAQENESRGYLVKMGEMAPDFTMTLDNGKVVKLSDMRGKVVMLQFTASWCGVCRKEMPYIEKEIWDKYGKQSDFVLWGIDLKEPLDKVQMLKRATKVTYPIGLDPEGKIFRLYAEPNAGVTRNVIIDKEGRIVYLTRLFNHEEFEGMCKEIAELMK